MKTLVRAILFTALLACMIAALELALARLNHATNGNYRVGQEIYQTIEVADAPHPRVTTVYLGDSVARQLFKLRTEPSQNLLYLCSNQAISLAGQYCLLQKVIADTPNLRHVYFFYTPRSFANNLDQIFSHDYFCGYFHSPTLVWEIWNLQHDRQLTEAHLGRMLLPNVMAENSYLNRSQSNYGVPIVPAGPESAHRLSRVSRYFIDKMRQLCDQRRITLKILPCPCMGNPTDFAQVAPVYDAPIMCYDPELFLPDQIHLRKANIEPVRKRLAARFQLTDDY